MKGMRTGDQKTDPPPRGAVEEVKVHAQLPGELVGEVGKEGNECALEGHGVLVGQVDVGAGDAELGGGVRQLVLRVERRPPHAPNRLRRHHVAGRVPEIVTVLERHRHSDLRDHPLST